MDLGHWVYVYAQFTQQALLFQALGILLLGCLYTAFWVLKKRRMGAVQSEIPSGVVKVYLNELIDEAEMLRAQLFGLLRTAGAKIEPSAHPSVAPTITLPSNNADDRALLDKISSLEARMADQARAMDALAADKKRIEAELAAARAASAGGSAKGGDPVVMNQLQDKIATLEGKLAEYSVIEDDLANLKRLQQENAQLKAAIQSGGGAIAAGAAAPVATDSVEVVPQPSDEPMLANTDAGFDQLVDQVEQSLEPAAAVEPSTASPAAASMEKSDADLVAEFEKMLKP